MYSKKSLSPIDDERRSVIPRLVKKVSMWPSWFKHDPSKKKGKAKQVEEFERQIEHSKDVNHPLRVCNGCSNPIEDGIYMTALDVLWHPLCLSRLHCQKPNMNQIPNSKGQLPNCYICEKKLPKTEEGREFSYHPFWKEKYCPVHEEDGTAKCFSCERLESCGTKYVMLADRRWLCLECLECAVMNTVECHFLHMEIRDFFEGLHMKIEQEFPVFLVEKETLNKAEKEEKIDNHYGTVTRGLCLSGEQIVKTVTNWRIGPDQQEIQGMDWKIQMVERKCEVTAILILYGLPRLLTGYILAHEMMHAWLRLNGLGNLTRFLKKDYAKCLATCGWSLRDTALFL